VLIWLQKKEIGGRRDKTLNRETGAIKGRQMFLELFTPLLVAILAGDLLYLYFGGWWHDPNQLIEHTEVVLMFSFFVGGWGRSIQLFLREWNGKNGTNKMTVERR
jgi:hypothetical protein